MSAVRLEGVTVRSRDGETLIEDVSLEVGEGEILWILGPSGSGKTTLLRVLAGIEPLRAGRIAVGDEVVATPSFSVPPERRPIGMVFQDPALFPHLDALGNVAFGLRRNGSKAKAYARALLARVGLEDAAHRHPHMLSGGEQQRVALARTLASDPAVVLLDEPFSDLDPQLRTDLAATECRILREEGRTAILVGHDPEDAMRFADRVAVMRGGRLLQLGTPREVYERPRDAFCAATLGLVNRVPGRVEDGSVCTPFGHVSADGIPEGSEVEWLVREEGFAMGGEGREARVADVRPLGPSVVVELDLGGRWPALHARVPAAGAPRPGEEVRVAVDAGRAFLFPASGG